jgi:RNA polymerase primary sigma factor
MAIAIRRRTPPTSVNREPPLSQKRSLLTRELPFIYSRRFQSVAFVAEHRQIARDVLATVTRTRGSEVSTDRASESWNLPELLTPEQERSLFVALNSLNYEANQLRASLKSRRPVRKQIERLRELIAEADAVRQHLCEANIRLVISIAGKLADQLVSYDDLFGEGLLILLKAIDGFDFSKGFRFSTYATNSLQRHFFRLRKRTLRKRQFGTPIEDEILHKASNGGDGIGLAPNDPLKLTHTIMQAASEVLDRREQRIVELRFGLSGNEHTLREIAAVLRVSKERVRQVLARAVGKLQEVATNLRLEWTPRELAAPARLGV